MVSDIKVSPIFHLMKIFCKLLNKSDSEKRNFIMSQSHCGGNHTTQQKSLPKSTWEYVQNIHPRILSSLGVHSSVTALSNTQILQPPPPDNTDVGVPDKLYKLIEVEVRGNDKEVLKSYAWFTKTAASHLGVEVGKSWTPDRPHHERYTVLRSVHVNKKCRVQYEFRTYFHFLQFHRLTGSTADTFLEYIQRNLPEGVAMKVTKVGLEPIPEYIQAPEKQDLAIEASSHS